MALLLGLCLLCCVAPQYCRQRRQMRGSHYPKQSCQECWGSQCQLFCQCSCLIIASITPVFIIGGIIAAFLVPFPGSKLKTYYSAPGDTHLFSYSSTYCEGLTVSDTDDTYLYLLNWEPSLSAPVNNLTASPPSTIEPDSYHHLSFFLYTGSKLNMTYCLGELSASAAVSFFLIKGSDNWDKWTHDRNSSHYKVNLVIANSCSVESKNLLYNFNSTDYYYFVFDNPSPVSTSYIEVTLMLQRTEYIVTDDDIFEDCDDYCSVPYKSHYPALMAVDGGGQYTSSSNVDILCVPRTWVYLLIVLVPLLFLGFTIISLCVLRYFIRRRRARLAGQPSVNTRDPSAPAPLKQDYGGMPSSYGTTQNYTYAYVRMDI